MSADLKSCQTPALGTKAHASNTISLARNSARTLVQSRQSLPILEILIHIDFSQKYGNCKGSKALRILKIEVVELTLWQQWWCRECKEEDRVLNVKFKHYQYHSQAPEVFLFTIKNIRRHLWKFKMWPEIDRLADVAGSIVSADLGYRKCTTVFVVIIVIISNEHIYS